MFEKLFKRKSTNSEEAVDLDKVNEDLLASNQKMLDMIGAMQH